MERTISVTAQGDDLNADLDRFPEVDPDDLKHFFEECHRFGSAEENHEF